MLAANIWGGLGDYYGKPVPPAFLWGMLPEDMELGSAPPSSSTRCLTSSQVPVLPEQLGAAKDKRGEYKI